MTRFVRAAADPDGRALFDAVLDRYCDGTPDRRTLDLITPV